MEQIRNILTINLKHHHANPRAESWGALQVAARGARAATTGNFYPVLS